MSHKDIKALSDAYLSMYAAKSEETAETVNEDFSNRDVMDSLAAVADYLIDALERNSDDVVDIVDRQASRRGLDDEDMAELADEVLQIVLKMLRDVNSRPQRYARTFG